MRRATKLPEIKVFDLSGELRPQGEMRAEIIRAGLVRYGGNITELAKALGIGRSTICRWISAEGLGQHLEECRRSAVRPDLPHGMAPDEDAGPT